MATPVLSADIAFEVNASNVGFISITSTTDWATAGIATSDVSVYLQITDPSGLIWHPFGLVDINPAVSNNATYQLQRATNGDPMAGAYLVEYRAVVVGAVSPGTYNLGPITATLCAETPSICVREYIDCLYMSGTVRDITKWGANGFTLVTRSMTLTWPANIPGGPTPVTTTGTSIPIPPGQLYTQHYSVLMLITATKDGTTYNFVHRYSFESDCVQSGQDLCSMLCCLEGAVTKMRAQTPNAQSVNMSKFSYMAALMVEAQAQASCGHGEQLKETLKSFYAEGGCKPADCGCGCTGGDCGDSGPTLLVPIYPGAGGSTVEVSIVEGAGISVDYNSGTNTWTISLANPALLAGLYNRTVSAGTGINVVNSGPTGNPPTYNSQVINTRPIPDSFDQYIFWDVRNSIIAASTPILVGTSFQAGITTTQFGAWAQYSCANFITPLQAPFEFRSEVTVIDTVLRQPWANDTVYGLYPFLEVPLTRQDPSNAATTFRFGFQLTCPGPGGPTGAYVTIPFIQTYMESVTYRIKIVRS